jgi:Zn finger protein HypA/HybF involved in hydrogenase expression
MSSVQLRTTTLAGKKMSEYRYERQTDCDSCERWTEEEAREQLCGNCSVEEERNAARLTRDYYLRKVAALEVSVKELNRTVEFLKREVARKGEQVEFLR